MPCVAMKWVTSLLAEDRAQREAADLERGERRSCEAARNGRAGETSEKRPWHGQVIGRRIEDVLQHCHEHLGEQPAENCGERKRTREDERGLAPEKRGGAAERC